MVNQHRYIKNKLHKQRFTTEHTLAATHFDDLYGNRCRRLLLPPGASTFSYDAVYAISPEPEPVPGPPDPQHRIEDLPDELLHWLLPSRYCESDVLVSTAWEPMQFPAFFMNKEPTIYTTTMHGERSGGSDMADAAQLIVLL